LPLPLTTKNVLDITSHQLRTEQKILQQNSLEITPHELRNEQKIFNIE